MYKIKFFLAFLLALISFSASAQYTSSNSFMRKALVLYQRDSNGFYQSKENVMVESVQNVVSAYAYNKKTHDLYVRTTNGNFVVSLNSEYAKLIKNNKNIPQLSEEQIETLSNAVNADLHKQFSIKNDSVKEEKRILREKEIQDSLNIVICYGCKKQAI